MPPSSRKRSAPSDEASDLETRNERHHRHYEELMVVLNKTVSGRYRNGQTNYDRVGVLLISWQADDLRAWSTEIQRLEAIFQEKYHYEVQHYHIPSEKPVTGLNRKVAEFAYEYDGPNNLAIVYYGGHGFKEDKRLKLYAKSRPDGDGSPAAFFEEVTYHLQRCDTDVLVITDCCYAAMAFSKVEVGLRKFELLTATGPNELGYAPQNPRSFTRLLCNTLEELSNTKGGFSTSKLYRELYFKVEEGPRPFLFDQSVHDWGRISLQPLGNTSSPPDPGMSPSKNGDAVLHMLLRLRSKPKPHSMNELARAMQYLPHVKEIQFQSMRAPRMQLEGFMQGVSQAMKLRPLVTRLRKQIDAKRQARLSDSKEIQHSRNEAAGTSPISPRDPSAMFNWDNSKLRKDRITQFSSNGRQTLHHGEAPERQAISQEETADHEEASGYASRKSDQDGIVGSNSGLEAEDQANVLQRHGDIQEEAA